MSVALPSPHEALVRAPADLDAATRRLYQEVVESPRHRDFIAKVRAMDGRALLRRAPPADTTLAIVPGAFYRENPRSGADGRVVRAQATRLGWTVETVPLASAGSTLENARILCEWLASRRESRIVLASVSKGGPDVKVALAQPRAARAFERVACWINLCGILDGTPLADWLVSWNAEAAFSRLYYRMKGVSVEFVRDLRRARGGPLDFALELPPHLRLVSLVGFPLRSHITSGLGRRCYDRMAPHGPNDGVIVLSDVCAQPGMIYPVWGADHLLRSGADMDRLLAALLGTVAAEMA